VRTAFTAIAMVAGLMLATADAIAAGATKLQGSVQSGGNGLSGYKVSLYVSFVDHGPPWKFLGSDTSNSAGNFEIAYALPPGLANDPSILFVQAERGHVMLASAISLGSKAPAQIVVNERTTVATGNAFAQFVDDRKISGNTYGMINALPMAANLANPQTGAIGIVLALVPNSIETSTLATFNSLTNVVASCVADDRNCTKLFEAATPPGGAAPTNVLQAIANIVKNPSYPGYPSDAADPVFLLSQVNRVYLPVLAQRPTNWLLFLKITGGFYSKQDRSNLMDGPGNFAIDEQGFVWINDNYDPRPEGEFACAGRRLIKLYPWGENFPGSPYFGGGLEGAGYGITLDPIGNVWVGNFGFEDDPCKNLPIAAKHNSVSLFESDGTPITKSGGYIQGNMSWPMSVISNRQGDIWVTNCGTDSLTLFPGGDPNRAINFPLGAVPPAQEPQIKPFGAVVDIKGKVWVNGNRSNSVYVVSPEGALIDTLPGTYQGKTILSHPIGNALDSKGNVWVSNSDWLDTPCPTHDMLGTATNPSVTMFQGKDRTPHPGSPFTGGGITLPWGIAVDGDDSVWVFNFGNVPPGPGNKPAIPTAVSRFCGVDTKKCPPGMKVGDPISPSTGYQSDSLQRITGGQIDPSGNVWLTNNWKIDSDGLVNPGGNAVVIAIGAAAPLRTPLIGPPQSFK
jgi:hypothetical protein